MKKAARLSKEIIKCGKNPVYFIKKYIKIYDSKKGLIKFNPTREQIRLINHIINNDLSITVKRRQIGATAIEVALSIWSALFYVDKNIVIVTHNSAMRKCVSDSIRSALADEALGKLCVFNKLILDQQCGKAGRLFEFENNSRIYCIDTHTSALKGVPTDLVFFDECAFYNDLQDIMSHVIPTVKKNGKVAFISTPSGTKSYFYTMATDKNYSTITIPYDNVFMQINYAKDIYKDLEDLLSS